MQGPLIYVHRMRMFFFFFTFHLKHVFFYFFYWRSTPAGVCCGAITQGSSCSSEVMLDSILEKESRTWPDKLSSGQRGCGLWAFGDGLKISVWSGDRSVNPRPHTLTTWPHFNHLVVYQQVDRWISGRRYGYGYAKINR